MSPETRYARSGDVNIAYQVVGSGAIDLVLVMGWASHIEWSWQEPSFARFLRRLASFTRLIFFDKRGSGLSDRVAEMPTFEQRMDDVRAVMDAVGSERAALLGISEGAAMCALFAAMHPERTNALITIGGFARRSWARDYPWGATEDERQAFLDQIERGWGGPVALARRAPSLATDEWFRQWWATYLRLSASPGAATALTRMNMEIDIRHVLPAIRMPSLIIHRTGDLAIPVEASRYLAERIPGARLVELSGADHLPFVGDQDAILDEVEEFLTGLRHRAELDTVLTTVLLTDIVGSTEHVARHGDRRWRGILEAHHALVRQELERFRGKEVGTRGDGFLATFDGPARAIRCACAISTAVRRLGLEIRAGVHTGECHLVGGGVEGMTVHIAARIAAAAAPGEVLVSGTVKDLVIGSGIPLEDRGSHALKGVEGQWHLFRVAEGTESGALTSAADRGTARHRTGPLTRREQEVATLIALGLSNRQIAEELVVAESTAERHVANILNKLGYHSRAQIAAWVVEEGLLSGSPA